MIDHAKHKTLKQCATRQCCRQESRGEQPGQSTRQPGPGFAAARIRDDQHNALQTGQASVGHGRALFFFIAVFSPAETSPEDEGKNGAVVGPLTDWILTLSHSTVLESLPIQVPHCDVAGGENLEVAMEAHLTFLLQRTVP